MTESTIINLVISPCDPMSGPTRSTYGSSSLTILTISSILLSLFEEGGRGSVFCFNGRSKISSLWIESHDDSSVGCLEDILYL